MLDVICYMCFFACVIFSVSYVIVYVLCVSFFVVSFFVFVICFQCGSVWFRMDGMDRMDGMRCIGLDWIG